MFVIHVYDCLCINVCNRNAHVGVAKDYSEKQQLLAEYCSVVAANKAEKKQRRERDARKQDKDAAGGGGALRSAALSTLSTSTTGSMPKKVTMQTGLKEMTATSATQRSAVLEYRKEKLTVDEALHNRVLAVQEKSLEMQMMKMMEVVLKTIGN